MRTRGIFFQGLHAVFAGLTALLLVGLTPVAASTADGETPANEGVCDVLQGGTPGLYGLCVAYCEAQDLDLVGDAEPPSDRILANYNKKKQAGDPEMPCIQVPCPCWTEAELASIAANATGPVYCSSTLTTQQIRSGSPLHFATVDIGRTPALCRYTDSVTRTSRTFPMQDPAAAQSCYDQVAAACSAVGY